MRYHCIYMYIIDSHSSHKYRRIASGKKISFLSSILLGNELLEKKSRNTACDCVFTLSKLQSRTKLCCFNLEIEWDGSPYN